MNNQEPKPSLPLVEIDRLADVDPIREKVSKLSRDERERLEKLAYSMIIGSHADQAAHHFA